jgi:hypothetical protein
MRRPAPPLPVIETIGGATPLFLAPPQSIATNSRIV